ncbi:MAG: 1-acyl-sn-glycerol-3-phosphate acyltransferase [Anaerolineae bacterium]|nr:1-acyl-sn-glycerol-3-phosphate acyltransferase [Anaerolineae bacterium]
MSRKIIIFLIKVFFKLTSRITLSGQTTAQKEGNYVVVANHLGVLDIALLYYIAERDDLIVIVADKHYESPLKRWIGNKVGILWIDRENPDVRLLKHMYTELKKGGLMVIAPEGTRSKTKSLLEGKPGAAYLAARGGVPILPAGMYGTEDDLVSHRLKHFQKLDLHICIGTPFTLPPLPKRDRDQILKQYTDEIMCQIAALLPPSYRGIYAEHPRTLELIDNQN